ncbi:acyltransferase family protein [Halomonas elongata]|uniref:acyltransferase family protein n=1 Tax=Halomonas elongata TaxID=2746 RepID=UPI0031B57D46
MQRVEEIYWLRAYGCLAVFAFHLLDHLNQRLDTLVTDVARIPTVFGTPVFIFISVFLFSLRYGNEVPRGFLGNRLKYIMVPYLVYGLAYAVAEFLRLHAADDDAGLRTSCASICSTPAGTATSCSSPPSSTPSTGSTDG